MQCCGEGVQFKERQNPPNVFLVDAVDIPNQLENGKKFEYVSNIGVVKDRGV